MAEMSSERARVGPSAVPAAAPPPAVPERLLMEWARIRELNRLPIAEQDALREQRRQERKLERELERQERWRERQRERTMVRIEAERRASNREERAWKRTKKAHEEKCGHRDDGDIANPYGFW